MNVMNVTIEINNMSELADGQWHVVARAVSGKLWYYGAYKDPERAQSVAEELGNAVICKIGVETL